MFTMSARLINGHCSACGAQVRGTMCHVAKLPRPHRLLLVQHEKLEPWTPRNGRLFVGTTADRKPLTVTEEGRIIPRSERSTE